MGVDFPSVNLSYSRNYGTYCALIHFNFFFAKVRHLLERIDRDEHRTNICLMGFYIKDHKGKENLIEMAIIV